MLNTENQITDTLKEFFNTVKPTDVVTIEHELVTSYLRTCNRSEHETNPDYLEWIAHSNGLLIKLVLDLHKIVEK